MSKHNSSPDSRSFNPSKSYQGARRPGMNVPCDQPAMFRTWLSCTQNLRSMQRPSRKAP